MLNRGKANEQQVSLLCSRNIYVYVRNVSRFNTKSRNLPQLPDHHETRTGGSHDRTLPEHRFLLNNGT